MVKNVEENLGSIEIIYNNAGIISDTLLMLLKIEEFDRVIDTNLKGTFYCTKFCLNNMIKNRWGRIINISSVVGLRGNVGQSNYSASKGGIHAFTKSVAKEVATRNITVNAVAPGYESTATTDVLTEKQKTAGRQPPKMNNKFWRNKKTFWNKSTKNEQVLEQINKFLRK